MKDLSLKVKKVMASVNVFLTDRQTEDRRTDKVI